MFHYGSNFVPEDDRRWANEAMHDRYDRMREQQRLGVIPYFPLPFETPEVPANDKPNQCNKP